MLVDFEHLAEDALAIDHDLALDRVDAERGASIRLEGLRFVGKAARSDRGARLEGRLTGRAELRCSRCLEPVFLDIDRPVELTLVAEPFDEFASDGPDADDSLYLAEGGRADLEAIAREQVYLSLPLKPVCGEDCQGLCPTCGANRNRVECGCSEDRVDPRLAPLLEFKRRSGR